MTPDFTQSASGLEPPTVLDHVLMPVADLGDGARRLYDRFGLQGIPGGRPGWQVRRWRTQDTEKDPDPVAIPFVIEWNIPEGLHPGQAAATHRNGVAAIKRVVVGARDPETVSRRLALLLGTTHIYEVRRSENEGVEELVIEHARGETVIR